MIATTPEDRCPPAWRMVAFLDGRMTAEYRSQIVQHIARCPACRGAYRAGTKAEEPPVAAPARRRALAGATLIALIVLAAFGAGIRWTRPRGIEALAEAADEAPFRNVEPRLSFSSAYQPLRRGPAAYWNEVDVEPGADPHLAGLLRLMAGDVRRALPLLERPFRDPGGAIDFDRAASAGPLTDLASAYYEEAIREARPIGFANAFEAAARAVELAPADPAPRSVLALVLEALSLRDDAVDAWKRYLALDASSPWAVEARRHLSALEATMPPDPRAALLAAARANHARAVQQLVQAMPLEARVYAEDELLREWGQETPRAEAAAATLASVQRIGRAIAEVSGDRTVTDCVDRILASSPGEIGALAKAHIAYGDARAAYARIRDERTRQSMLTAARLLETAQSPLAPRPAIFAATITHYGGNNDEALAMLDRVLTQLRGREASYPVAAGQALWTRGLIESVKARPHEALQSYLAARALLVKTHEASNISGIETGLAQTYRYLGDTENDWTHQLLSLQASAGGTVYARRQSPIIDTAMASIDTRRFRLAALLLDRVEKNAQREGDFIYQVAAKQIRSRIFVARKNARAALEQLDGAKAVAEAQQPTPTTSRMAGDLALARAEAMRDVDPSGALELLSLARMRSRELSLQDRQAQIHLLSGQAHEAMNDLAAAEAEYRAGVDEVERQRGQISSDEERSTFTDTGRSLFDATIALLVSRNDSDGALKIVRRARTIGLTQTRFSAPDPRALLVEYYVLPDALLTWVTQSGATRMIRQPLDRDALTTRIQSNVTRIANCDEAVHCRENAASLFDLLLQPLGAALESSEDLVIAPDAIVHQVPFAALVDRTRNRALIEDHTITITLGSGAIDPRAGFRSILVAAAPGPGGDLASLGAVAGEARKAAEKFASARVLQGRELTPSSFLAATGDYEVVHYAGHALWNERRPRFAALRLAPADERSDGSLYAYEVANHHFAKTRLVVLAGCDTARGRLAGVGLLSFARTFLAAGVPQVVGSLWPAGDRESASIFTDFYAALAGGASPAAALRDAQRNALRRRGPASWATFQLYATGNPEKER